MIPIGDSLRSRSFPGVNYAIIALNFAVFFYELSISGPRRVVDGYLMTGLDRWMLQWGAVGCRITESCTLPDSFNAPNPWLTLLTAAFIHAGWLHLLGNMLFLWIFGDNVEDTMGHAGYALFYLIVALVAGLAQVASAPDSTVPGVGASGAIAGVMAAYLVLYPGASVRVLIPIIIIPWITRLPAFFVMLFWFGSQIWSGLGELGARATGGSGGVAWFAHIGGFIAGLILAPFFRTARRSLDTRRRFG